jgi:hypothetical protein
MEAFLKELCARGIADNLTGKQTIELAEMFDRHLKLIRHGFAEVVKTALEDNPEAMQRVFASSNLWK